MKRLIKGFLATSITLQSILLLTALVCVFPGAISGDGYLMAALLSWFFLGCWQVISALFVGGLSASTPQLVYFGSALVYCMGLVGVSEATSILPVWFTEEVFFIVFVGIVPLIGAIWLLSDSIRIFKGRQDGENLV